MSSSTDDVGSMPDPHLEYLYGPQWHAVANLIERAAFLSPLEYQRLDTVARTYESRLLDIGGGPDQPPMAGLRNGSGTAARIAAATAEAFGRTRNVHIARFTVWHAVSSGAEMTNSKAILQSTAATGRLGVVRQAVTAEVLRDLVGRGRFEQSVFDQLIEPWRTAIEW